MGAEPARVLAAPRSELGGAAPKREAAAAQPLPPQPPREDRERGRFGDRDRDRGRDRGGDRGRFGDRDRGRGRPDGIRSEGPRPDVPRPEGPRPDGRRDEATRVDERGPRRDDRDRGRDRGPRREERPRGAPSALSADEAAEVAAARGSLAAERADLEAAEASPEALDAGREILEQLMQHLGFAVRVDVQTGDTSRLNVVGDGEERDALGALIGRKGERLSALQHLVNLMLSKRMGGWTRVLVDVEDYRGRRERQLRELADRAAARVVETGKMLQLEAMPALERRWIHLALRENPNVATQSIGEEPNRRIVVLPREG
jgi:predicted RNA-binding protein Jag